MSGSLESSITLEDVFAMVGAKRVPLAPELAGYLTLEIADKADAAGGDVDPKSVYIAEEGSVALVRPKRATTTGDAEASIRAILARLLEASGSQTPALTATSRRKAAGKLRALSEELEAALIPVNRAAGRRALARLAREVKRVTLGVGRNASVPAARGPSASHPSYPEARTSSQPGHPPAADSKPQVRAGDPPSKPTAAAPSASHADVLETAESALGQVEAATSSSNAPPASKRPSSPAGDVDSLLASFEVSNQRGDKAVSRELKAMVGLDPTPPPPTSGGESPSAPDASVEALLAMTDPSAAAPAVSPPPAPASKAAPPAKRVEPARPAPKPASVVSTGPSIAVAKGRASAASSEPVSSGRIVARRPASKGADRALLFVLLVLLVAGAIGLWMLKPGWFTGRTPEKVAEEKAAAVAAQVKATQQQRVASCKALLVVGDVPPNAEVLLRAGQAPADVDHMPVGARLEFVATAEGFAPKRTVVPAGATWDTGTDGKPRYEVAVQLDKSSGKPKGDLWPAGEPGSEVGGQGPPGTVHIVSTPRGAEVWLLAGMGPEARIELLPCDTDVDVLVAGPTSLRKRLHVAATDFVADPSGGASARTAKISAK